ncbi:hypothetical protein FN846DRAFT_946452 [Sphaerosporella brunnea]|uniref:Uncharacterized protein n=1 Tax=Sphaerosporella brunnea TaxID=1250544 RepID=A0A5J5EYY5_9PEZI|nr:hypothetical protein FN846DRAFT_946452 [Sphaerosporella brunnea]
MRGTGRKLQAGIWEKGWGESEGSSGEGSSFDGWQHGGDGGGEVLVSEWVCGLLSCGGRGRSGNPSCASFLLFHTRLLLLFFSPSNVRQATLTNHVMCYLCCRGRAWSSVLLPLFLFLLLAPLILCRHRHHRQTESPPPKRVTTFVFVDFYEMLWRYRVLNSSEMLGWMASLQVLRLGKSN